MKIAFTGSSSTGKTTLATILQEDIRFQELQLHFITVDARSILNAQGFRSMDQMLPGQLQNFQHLYLERKLSLENGHDDYFTDRSFVDVAAYWLERDAEGISATNVASYVDCCLQAANRYDLHFYFPYGLLRFESDGYRSESSDFHVRIDWQIRRLLCEWGIKPVLLDMIDLSTRCEAVLAAINGVTLYGRVGRGNFTPSPSQNRT